ncbi:hypothetical protein AVEN_141559-1 [Araneus ventricosus]|uniref:Uncharacterized protein n=1 Tax=Araneus ventricosus TaxID=182803 RepID=A0A4Y2PMQ9_ARAVE|nr:hypothetical protein AVEN_141559-1 [Araneus ventricosus]
MGFLPPILLLLIAVFHCLLAEISLSSSRLECAKGASWKMDASRLFDVKPQNAARLLPEGNFTDSFKISNKLATYDRECDSMEASNNFFDCPFREEKIYDENRLPQVMSTVRCLQTIETYSKKIRHGRRTQCEEVRLQVPVLRKNSCVEGQENYSLVWETASVACIRTVRASRLRSKPVHRISFDALS